MLCVYLKRQEKGTVPFKVRGTAGSWVMAAEAKTFVTTKPFFFQLTNNPILFKDGADNWLWSPLSPEVLAIKINVYTCFYLEKSKYTIWKVTCKYPH